MVKHVAFIEHHRLLAHKLMDRSATATTAVVTQLVACPTDGEALLMEQVANPPDQQHFVVLVIAAVAAALHRLELAEFLLPVAQHIGLDPAQLADLTDREVAFGWNRWQQVLHEDQCAKGGSSDSTSSLARAGRRPEQSP